MKTGTQFLGALLPIVALAAVIAGCEDAMDPVAPSDGKIGLTAQPTVITLDPNGQFPARDDTGQLVGTSNISALVTDKNGLRMQNVAVLFSASGGTLQTASPNPVYTDPNGFAANLLTVKESDPVDKSGNLTVNAQSGLATGTLTIAKVIVPCTPPVVVVPGDIAVGADLCSPTCDDGLGCTVVLSGGVAEDTSGALVTYQWECGNGGSLPDPGDTATCCYLPTAPPVPAYEAKLKVTINRFPPPQGGCTAVGENTVTVAVR